MSSIQSFSFLSLSRLYYRKKMVQMQNIPKLVLGQNLLVSSQTVVPRAKLVVWHLMPWVSHDEVAGSVCCNKLLISEFLVVLIYQAACLIELCLCVNLSWLVTLRKKKKNTEVRCHQNAMVNKTEICTEGTLSWIFLIMACILWKSFYSNNIKKGLLFAL